ncbi:MAG: DUF3108 domain-containing protein [Planctomycetota bacterium]|nr:MAG: DUF3108 domain-containing protein [Planctomycetota bacterium]
MRMGGGSRRRTACALPPQPASARGMRAETLESNRLRRPQSPLVSPPAPWLILVLAGVLAQVAAPQSARNLALLPRTTPQRQPASPTAAPQPASAAAAAPRSTAAQSATPQSAATQSAAKQGAAPQSAATPLAAAQETAPSSATAPRTPLPLPAPALVVDRGPGELPLAIPRDEELEFIVHVEYGVIAADLGHVWLKSGVKPYRASLIVPRGESEAEQPPKETGWIQARAKGGNFAYESDTTLTAWHLPQVWPRLRFLHEQRGSEERTFELLVGTKDGDARASLRKDTDKGAPRGTRIWKDATERKVPAAAIDMVSAGYLSRQLFTGGADEIKTTLIDKHKVWDVRMKKGKRMVLQVDAGRFDAVELEMTTTRPASEPVPKDASDAQFQGPFGIHGNLRIFLEASTGVPLRFDGIVPLGILGDLRAEIRLVKYRGTPAAFAPKAAPAQNEAAR